MITALTYISIICGGLLVLLLLIGIIGGLDLDFDADFDTDVDPGVGIVKGGLTFLSIGAWVTKLILLASVNPVVAIVSGVAAGAGAVYVMSHIFKLLLKQEHNVNWEANDALLKAGKVYLKIPADGTGLVHVKVKGAVRELKAASQVGQEIPTGTPILVHDVTEDGLALVAVKE